MTSGHREFRQNPDDRIVFLTSERDNSVLYLEDRQFLVLADVVITGFIMNNI